MCLVVRVAVADGRCYYMCVFVCVFACLCVFLHQCVCVCVCVCVIMYGCRYVGLLVGGIRWHLEDIWKDVDAFGSTGSI